MHFLIEFDLICIKLKEFFQILLVKYVFANSFFCILINYNKWAMQQSVLQKIKTEFYDNIPRFILKDVDRINGKP